ncbi:hypothetical protein [Flagellimonas zhangzhouensis]|uniref:Uncharacterized protein n=1 Tax=Flagellimonas zhangzhouensis TaxID=1073328 RepID=A0A1H2Q4N4_9FLAO|nr:hypothetical protein [Allomuricauda zhangzhouensis]SDQ48355.1 hypothetical protein SAMN05216294_1414 [Allomuricauda zhangzhouensis]SDW02137.1 hypothetical protein SAMN04487892_0065 [Allomuricauda zhangzhouensis]
MKTRILYILVFALGISGFAHAQLNKYKYIIVPKKFDAFKEVNEYQTSTLIKYYFAENGFNVVYDDALPIDLAGNRCTGLVADVIDESGMFSTKIFISLKDCQNKEVFRSLEGKSKIKDFGAAYKEAIQNAFVSFAGMGYSYDPDAATENKNSETVTLSYKNDVKTVEPKSTAQVIEQKATPEEQVYKSVEPIPSSIVSGDVDVLYAQAIPSGYQLVDNTPKVVLTLQETSMQYVFMTEYEGNNAVVFLQDGQWMLEYSVDGKKQQKKLNIKF